LEGRPVSLQEARAHLVEWARELIALTPADLRAFARGTSAAPGVIGLDEAQRTHRAADLLFYLRGLLELDGDDSRLQWRAPPAETRDEPQGARSMLELCADVRARFARGGTRPDAASEGRGLEQRLAHYMERLELLARWLQLEPEESAPGDG